MRCHTFFLASSLFALFLRPCISDHVDTTIAPCSGDTFCVSTALVTAVHTDVNSEAWCTLWRVADECCGDCSYNQLYWGLGNQDHDVTLELLQEYTCDYYDVNCGAGWQCSIHVTSNHDAVVDYSCEEDPVDPTTSTTRAPTNPPTNPLSDTPTVNPNDQNKPNAQESGLTSTEIAGVVISILLVVGFTVALTAFVCIKTKVFRQHTHDSRGRPTHHLQRRQAPTNQQQPALQLKAPVQKASPAPQSAHALGPQRVTATPFSRVPVPAAPIPVANRNHLPQRPTAPGDVPGNHPLATKVPLAVVQGAYRKM